jgi:hypothetical protein
MAEDNTNQELQPAAVLLEWEYPERPVYERGRLWYIFMGLAGLGLLIYAVYSANFLFALMVIMFGLVIYITASVRPANQPFIITEQGIVIGNSEYRFREIEKFWFYYEPPVKALYIELKGLTGRQRIDLMDQDPNQVRELIGQFVPEDLEQDEEPLSDILSRLFKI